LLQCRSDSDIIINSLIAGGQLAEPNGTATPVISELVSSGKVKVVGGVYELATGKITA